MVSQGKTGNGVVSEQYPGNNNEVPIIFFAGIGVRPIKDVDHTSKVSSYLGLFPDLLNNSSTTEVGVVYQPGVSGGKHIPNFYSDETEVEQFKAALELADGRRFYPIGHSLSARLPIRLALTENYGDSDVSHLLDGCAIAPMTTAEDALTRPDGKKRRLLGIPWIQIMKLTRNFPAQFYYPLHSQKINDGNDSEEIVDAWKPNFLIDLRSGKDLMEYDTLAEIKASTVYRHPLIIITKQDKIFDPGQQREIGKALESEVFEVDAGHRCFTTDNILNDLVGKVVEHYQSCLS